MERWTASSLMDGDGLTAVESPRGRGWGGEI